MSYDEGFQTFVSNLRQKFGLPLCPPPKLSPPTRKRPHPKWQEIYSECSALLSQWASKEIPNFDTLAAFIEERRAGHECSSSTEPTVADFIYDTVKQLVAPTVASLANHVIYNTPFELVPSLPSVLVLPLDLPLVVAVATYGTDANQVAEQFRAKFKETFGSTTITLGLDPATYLYFLHLQHQGLTPTKMFNRYCRDFPKRVKEQPGTPEFNDEKTRMVKWIKKTIPPFEKRLQKVVRRGYPGEC